MKMVTAVCLTALLVGCTAQMKVANSQTERGFPQVRDYEIGQVLQWVDDQKRLAPLARLTATTRQTTEPLDLKVRFESGVEFTGGVSLPDTAIDALEAEVSRRATTELKNADTRTLKGTLTRLVEDDWNARPEVWRSELGISDGGWSPGDVFYVAIVYKQTIADKLTVEVDNTTAAGAKFTSSVKKSGANVKFTISDAATLELLARGGRAPVYYDIEVVRIINSGGEQPKFSIPSVPREIRQEILDWVSGR